MRDFSFVLLNFALLNHLYTYFMSEQIKHECGIALVRLLKPLEYYQEKYGTSLYGLNKLR